MFVCLKKENNRHSEGVTTIQKMRWGRALHASGYQKSHFQKYNAGGVVNTPLTELFLGVTPNCTAVLESLPHL